MGLDAVELVLAFEEEFGICVPDSAAEKMRTPRDVINFVVEARCDAEQKNARAKVLNSLSEMGCSTVSFSTSFNTLFPRKGRARRWNEFRAKLTPFAAPSAKRSGPGCSIVGAGLLTLIACLLLKQWTLACISAVVVAAGWLIDNLSMIIPQEVDTVQKLVARLTRPISEQEVAVKVKSIIIEQLGLKPEAYGEDKRFIEDFHID